MAKRLFDLDPFEELFDSVDKLLDGNIFGEKKETVKPDVRNDGLDTSTDNEQRKPVGNTFKLAKKTAPPKSEDSDESDDSDGGKPDPKQSEKKTS